MQEAELVDTRPASGRRGRRPSSTLHYATNRPEDVEVDEDGTVYIALTNNSTANDIHGSIRRLREAGNDPTAVGPARRSPGTDYAAGGPDRPHEPGEQGFSSPDNLVFDKAGQPLGRHRHLVERRSTTRPTRNAITTRNNAVFMVPRTGPNAGVAFRFANMPIEAEGTGPYFTPDEQTLFVNVQHPGEETPTTAKGGVYGNVSTYTSYWPKGNKTTGQNPSTPIPSLVAISKIPPGRDASARRQRDPAAARPPTARRRAWRSCPPPARTWAR